MYWSEATGLPPSNLTGALTCLCCIEEEDLQGVVWSQGRHVMCDHAFHIIDAEPSEAPTEDQQSQ
jgi:hypothetical protein